MTRLEWIGALLASLALHAVPLSVASAWSLRLPEAPALALQQPEEDVDAPAAVWAGETFDIDTSSERAAEGARAATSSAPADVRPAAAPAEEPPDASRPGEPTEPARSRPPAEPSSPNASPAKPPAPARVPAAEPAAEAAASPSGDAPAHGTGSYGATEAAAVAAPLGKGLLRVLPRAAFVEPTFHELPIGASARLRFSIDLDEDGRAVAPVRIDVEQARIQWLEALLGRAVLLLRAGAFSLPAGASGPASSAFELEFEITQGAAASGDWAEPHDLAEIGRLVEPTRTQPGRAHFRYNSGREVQLVLKLR